MRALILFFCFLLASCGTPPPPVKPTKTEVKSRVAKADRAIEKLREAVHAHIELHHGEHDFSECPYIIHWYLNWAGTIDR